MLEFAPPHDKVTRLDIPVDDFVFVEVLDTVKHLQCNHEYGFECEPPSAFLSDALKVVPQFLEDEVCPAVLLEGLLDFWESMEMRLFQFLISLNFVLDELLLVVGVALDEEDGPVLPHTLLHHLVAIVLEHLHSLILPLYH